MSLSSRACTVNGALSELPWAADPVVINTEKIQYLYIILFTLHSLHLLDLTYKIKPP